MALSRPWLGVSACLCGQAVRYDARDKHAHFIAQVLPRHFDIAAICPEVGVGMSIPRPPMQLEVHGEDVRVRGVEHTELDMTYELTAFAARQAERYPGLAGYIFKRGSPSCGLDVALHGEAVPENARGRGRYAEELLQRLAPLPAIQEDWLLEASYRESFFEAVFARHRFRACADDPDALTAFHQAYAPLLEARGASLLILNLQGNEFLQNLLASLAQPLRRDIDARMLFQLSGPDAKARDAAVAYARGESVRHDAAREVVRVVEANPREAHRLRWYLQPLPDDLVVM